MTEREKKLWEQSERRERLGTFVRGIKNVLTRKWHALIFVVLAVVICRGVVKLCGIPQPDIVDLSAITTPSYCALGIMALLVVVYVLGIIPGAKEMHNNLERVGVVNHVREAPTVKSIEKLDKQLRRITFDGKGLRAADWVDMQGAVEAALNLVILRIDDGKKMREVIVWGIPPMRALPEKIMWNPELASGDKYRLVLGVSKAGIVDIALNKTPHWLVSSATGGGKTQLILLIIEQCLQKGMQVTIADWKMGMDFSSKVLSRCNFVCDYGEFKLKLNELRQVIKERADKYERVKWLTEGIACNNTDVYFKMTGEELQHHVLVIDEASMVLDSTGRSKEEKLLIAEVESAVADIGRIGRAYGVHLFVCTQRPDVNSVSGRIKANLDGRICGHMADNTSSMVVLDNANAAKLPAIPGRFILQDGAGVEQVFQAYLPR